MENSGKQNPKMGFKSPPRAEMPICKLLFLNNLCSKTVGQIQNHAPHRLMPRLKSKTTPGDPDARFTGFRSRAQLLASRCGDTKQHHSVQRGDALRILERSGDIAQAELTKIHRQRIPELRAAIEYLSKGWTGEGFDKLDKFGAIQEIAVAADHLAAIAETHIEALEAQRSSLIIAPTHGECRSIAGAVRKAMKKKGLLLDSGTFRYAASETEPD
jgi:hypothetical protein